MMVDVLITRPSGQTGPLEGALRDEGIEPILVPAIAVSIDPPGGQLDVAARVLHTFDWVVVTSANGARAVLRAAERVLTALDTPRWAAVGDATAAVLEREGIAVDFRPSRSDGATLAAEMPVRPGRCVLLLRGDLAGSNVPRILAERGVDVYEVVAYRTTEAPESSRSKLREALSLRPPAAVLFGSGSAVRGVIALAEAEHVDLRRLPAICSGPDTAREAARLGFGAITTSPSPDVTSVAATTAAVLAHGTR